MSTRDDGEHWWINSAAVLQNVHATTLCAGRNCVLHDPSDHHMRDWPLNWRGDTRVMERLCPHGVGHPDPDDVAFHASRGETWQAIHGCDGCCAHEADA